MKLPNAMRAAAAVALAVAAVGSHAAAETVLNGSFASNSNSTQASWTDNSVEFSTTNGGGGGSRIANFSNGDDWLTQVLGSSQLFSAGTSFVTAFFYDKQNTSSAASNNLNVRLEMSATGTGGWSLFEGWNVANTQTDGNLSFASGLLSSSSYVRVVFDSLQPSGFCLNNCANSRRYFGVDNVSVLAAAPIPEPSTYALLLAGLGAVGFVANRRRPRDEY